MHNIKVEWVVDIKRMTSFYCVGILLTDEREKKNVPMFESLGDILFGLIFIYYLNTNVWLTFIILLCNMVFNYVNPGISSFFKHSLLA